MNHSKSFHIFIVMFRFIPHWFFLCIYFCFAIATNGQEISFKHLSTQDGIPQNTTYSIIQDKAGFMWFGTQDGLCRYDGYTIKVYKHNDEDSNSLKENFTMTLHEDKEGMIWVSMLNSGIDKFNPETEVFTHHTHNPEDATTIPNNNVTIELEQGDYLWLGTRNGFCKLNKKTGEAKSYINKQVAGSEHLTNFVGSIAAGAPNILWLTSDYGISKFNTQTETFKHYTKIPFGSQRSYGALHNIRSNNGKLLLYCTLGLVELDTAKNTDTLLVDATQVSPGNRTHILNGLVTGNLYRLCTSQGLVYYNRTNGNMRVITHDEKNRNSISNNYILSICKSRDGVLWVGTDQKLNYTYKEDSDFLTIKQATTNKDLSNDMSIFGLAEDVDGNIWMGTSDGIKIYNKSTGSIQKILSKENKTTSLATNRFLCIHKDKSNNIWASVKRYDFVKIPPPADDVSGHKVTKYSFNNTSVNSFADYNDSLLLMGTGYGFVLYNKNTESKTIYPYTKDNNGPSNNFVVYVYCDKYNNIWMGTIPGGLNLFDPVSRKFLHFKNNPNNKSSLSNNIVLTIFQTKNDELLIGTMGGLNKLKIPLQENMFEVLSKIQTGDTTPIFQRYTTKQNLPSNVVIGIVQDNHGYVWLSTSNGIAKLDMAKQLPVLNTYNAEDGLQDNEFNQNASLITKDGYICFGGIKGLNIFHPDSIQQNTTAPPVYITDFRLYNKSVPINKTNKKSDSLTLTKAIQNTSKITLDYDDDIISFEFAALNFINPAKNQYKYKLEGFQEDWIEADKYRTATFTDLDAGTYIFRVIASNNEGVWNNEGASMVIEVKPAPWLSWYAYALYICLAIFLSYLFIKARIRAATRELEVQNKIEKAKLQEREEFRKKSSQDFHDEAGSKITKINLFTELAKGEDINEQTKSYLNRINQNTNDLSSGMRDFIWALDPEKDSLFDTILRLKDHGENMFTELGKSFTVNGLTESLRTRKLSMDIRRNMLLIFKEAMNNCAKYADAKNVVLDVHFDDGKLRVALNDDGKGFDTEKEEHQKGYGQKTMKDRAQKINSILTVTSEIGKGTTVLLNCNIPLMRDV